MLLEVSIDNLYSWLSTARWSWLMTETTLCFQAPEERNYHVFYEMLEALTDEQKGNYGLQTAPKYFYLNQVSKAESALSLIGLCYVM